MMEEFRGERDGPERQQMMRESHPELLFSALNGGKAVTEKKKSAEGIEKRLAILDHYHEEASRLAGYAFTRFPKRRVQPDDIVDAPAAAVVAFKYRERLHTVPRDPPFDHCGLRMEIAFPRMHPYGWRFA